MTEPSDKDVPTNGDKSRHSSVIAVGYVDPNTPSPTQVSAGFYSLNKRSNVPFVKFVGSAGFQKTITWGEPTVIPKGEIVTVYNASYHGGDIFLSRDEEPCNRPSRISVPVQYTVKRWATGPDRFVWQASFPCDVRAAKRAYFMADARSLASGLTGVNLFVRGRRLDGSMQTANALASYGEPYGPGVGFVDFHNVPQQQAVAYVPLGQGAPLSDDSRPHNLLDAHDVFMDMGTSNVLTNFLQWPASGLDLPSPVRAFPPAPETFYVVEYD